MSVLPPGNEKFNSLLIGIAIGKGFIKDENEPILLMGMILFC